VKTHHPIPEETIERYIRRELADEERLSFEEHLLECPECFEETQLMERFVAGVRHSARAGVLGVAQTDRRQRALIVALAASLAVVLIGGGVWIYSLQRSLSILARPLPQVPSQAEVIAGNLPIAVLHADRAAGGESILRVPSSTREIALWLDVEAGGRYNTFSVTLLDEGQGTVETVAGLTRNSEGAIAVVLPASKFPEGRYKVRLSSEAPARLLAQYNLRIDPQVPVR
jgi:anti-sigma factor RsiW